MKDNNISLFAVSFRQGFVSPNVPIATFYQKEKALNFVLDSGSDANVIDEKVVGLLEHVKKEPDATSCNKLNGVGGSKDVSICTLSFNTEEEKYTEDFLVADMSEAFNPIKKDHCIVIHGILGSGFLTKHNAILDFKNLSAYSKQ